MTVILWIGSSESARRLKGDTRCPNIPNWSRGRATCFREDAHGLLCLEWQKRLVNVALAVPGSDHRVRIARMSASVDEGQWDRATQVRRHSKCLFVCLLMVVCSQFSCCKHLIQLRTKQYHEVRLFSSSRHLRLACTCRRRRDGGYRGTSQRGPPDGPQVWRRRTRGDPTCRDESHPVDVGTPRAKRSGL